MVCSVISSPFIQQQFDKFNRYGNLGAKNIKNRRTTVLFMERRSGLEGVEITGMREVPECIAGTAGELRYDQRQKVFSMTECAFREEKLTPDHFF